MEDKKYQYWIILVLALLLIGLMKVQAYPYTKVFVGEDSGILIYGIQSEIEIASGISYYGEIETWLGTSRETWKGWQIQKIEYTLRLDYDNISLEHQCQHYLDRVDDWDSQNFINVRIDFPDNTDRRK